MRSLVKYFLQIINLFLTARTFSRSFLKIPLMPLNMTPWFYLEAFLVLDLDLTLTAAFFYWPNLVVWLPTLRCLMPISLLLTIFFQKMSRDLRIFRRFYVDFARFFWLFSNSTNVVSRYTVSFRNQKLQNSGPLCKCLFQKIFEKFGCSVFDLAAAKITHNFHSMIIIELDEEEKPLKDRGEKCKFRPRCIALWCAKKSEFETLVVICRHYFGPSISDIYKIGTFFIIFFMVITAVVHIYLSGTPPHCVLQSGFFRLKIIFFVQES